MGVDNQQRRAVKAKRRAKERARRTASGGWSASEGRGEPLFTPAERVLALLDLAAMAVCRGDEEDLARVLDHLLTCQVQLVDRQVEGRLLSLVATMWDLGWLPAEVIRQAARADARAGRLVSMAVAADHRRRQPSTLHPRWADHVEHLTLPGVADCVGWLTVFGEREELDRRATLRVAAVAIHALGSTGPLPRIVPPPGSSEPSTSWSLGASVDDPVLQKVRALLAQAESTTFEAEAAAFTAKAQELMARHAIDMAVLWAGSEHAELPTTVRLPIDDPYADAKALLLHVVAQHSRCQAVRHPGYGLASVVGFASDLAATELLFTSLLVQSQAALQAEGAKAGPGAHTRSRAFRSSFLMSFSQRINQRLAEVNATVQRGAAAAHDDSLLPVLAARDDAVDDAVRELFGELASDVVRGGSDPTGWVRGRLAADLARLNAADLARVDQLTLALE
jgi:hypothetical protein